MPIPDVPSLSYGTTDNAVYEFQMLERNKLWEEQVVRVQTWVETQEFDTNTCAGSVASRNTETRTY